MKLFKKLNTSYSPIIIIGIILLLFLIFRFARNVYLKSGRTISETASVARLPFADKNFEFDYNALGPSAAVNISTFDPSDNWTGSGYIDSTVFYEYPSSLTLAGNDGKKLVAFKYAEFDLGRTDEFEILVNLRTDPGDLELSSLIFTDKNFRTARYALPIIANGWQILKFDKGRFVYDGEFSWHKIIRTGFKFIPRPFGTVVVSLSGLRSFANLNFDNDWNFTDKRLLVLDNRQNGINLLARNMGQVPIGASLKKIITASDFTFQCSFSPLSKTWSGIFIRGNYLNNYGYYLMVNGLEGSQWQFYKVSLSGLKLIKNGIIPDFQFKYGNMYELKVEAEEELFHFYISKDNKNFIRLGSATDGDFRSGGVGIAIGNGAVSLYKKCIFLNKSEAK